MVTLPKSWVETQGLKKNDPVSVCSQSGGGLLLTAGGNSSDMVSSKVLSVEGFDDSEALYRCLIGAYIAGHDQIILTSEVPFKGAYLEAISKFTQTSMGMEIVEEEEDRITIKDLIDHSEVIPHKNVRREYLLVKRMVGDVMSQNCPSLLEMESRDTEVDRIHWLVQRQSSIHQQDISLCAKMGLRLGSVTSCNGVSKILERMGDHAVLLVKNLEQVPVGDRRIFTDLMVPKGVELVTYIEKAMGSWLDADNKLAEDVIRRKGDMLEGIRSCFGKVSDMPQIDMLVGSITRLVEYCSDIAESAINLAME